MYYINLFISFTIWIICYLLSMGCAIIFNHCRTLFRANAPKMKEIGKCITGNSKGNNWKSGSKKWEMKMGKWKLGSQHWKIKKGKYKVRSKNPNGSYGKPIDGSLG